jgi:anti-repressor protein
MTDIQIFTGDFGQVRTINKNGEPWFVAADVCRVLEHSNVTVALDRLDDDDRAKFNLGHPMFETNCVNESGLYTLVLGSRKPEAKHFKRWITHEVIPSIRKTGGYVANDDLFLSTYLPNADEATAALFKTTLATVRSLNARIEQDKPKVLFASAVETSKTSILIGELAKLIRQNGVEIGQNRLFTWLRENGYLIKRSGTDFNMPTQRSMERGWFEVKETAISRSGGSITVSKTTKVTGKGQTYFVNAFLCGQVSL